MDKFNFNQSEEECLSIFEKKFFEEEQICSELFTHFETLVSQTNRNIPQDKYPDTTIEVLLVYNLTLLYYSLNTLKKGYFGIALAILRIVIEHISLSIYFYEFPDDEKLYRKNTKRFYNRITGKGYSRWIEGVLERVDKEGDKLVSSSKKDVSWKQLLMEMANDSSLFIHANPDVVTAVVLAYTKEDVNYYCLGPNHVGDDYVKNACWKIIQAMIINTVVFDTIFSNLIPQNDAQLIKTSVNKLNKYKSSLNEKETD